MKNIRPGDPVYAFRLGCGLGLAFRGIVLELKQVPNEKGEFNARALVLDTSVPGRPRIAESTRLHRDSGTSRAEARALLRQYGYNSAGEEDAPGPQGLTPA